MADNLGVTPGVGATLATDDVGGAHFQRMKLVDGTDGSAAAIPGDVSNGLDVDVTRVQGTVAVTDNGGSLTVDGTVAVTDGGGSLTVDGAVTVSDGGNVITVDGTVAVTDGGGSLTIDVAALPLPAGASTEATLALIKTNSDKIPAAPAAEHTTSVSPNAARLSDGTSFYDAAKTAQLPTALVGGRLDVNLGAIGAAVAVPVTDNAGSLTVDAPVTTPAFVRLSDGAAAITALPVTDNGGNLSIDDGGNTITVDGTVTVNQGTPAVAANAWPAKISDGTDTVGISTVSAAKALKVDVVQSVTAGQADKSTLTEAVGVVHPIAGWFSEANGADPDEDDVVAIRATAERALWVNLRTGDNGYDFGAASEPVYVRGQTTKEPVYTALHPNPAYGSQAAFRNAVAFGASETAVALYTPSNAFVRFVVYGLIFTVTSTGAGGTLTIYDGANAAASILYRGNPAVGVHHIPLIAPLASQAVAQVLRYSTGTNIAGDIVVWGVEA